MALVTLSEVKAALGLGDESDARITALLDPVSEAIEEYTGRAFSSAAVVEEHAGGGRHLYLRRLPVTVLTSVTDRANNEVIESDTYELSQDGMLTRLPFGSRWLTATQPSAFYNLPSAGILSPDGALRWRVSYTGGPTEAPANVKLAAYETFAGLLREMGGATSLKDGDFAISFAASTGLPSSAMGLLSRYRSRPI